jgi:hypothetical protein
LASVAFKESSGIHSTQCRRRCTACWSNLCRTMHQPRPDPNSTIVTRRGPMMDFLPRSVAPVLWATVDVNSSRLSSSRWRPKSNRCVFGRSALAALTDSCVGLKRRPSTRGCQMFWRSAAATLRQRLPYATFALLGVALGAETGVRRRHGLAGSRLLLLSCRRFRWVHN